MENFLPDSVFGIRMPWARTPSDPIENPAKEIHSSPEDAKASAKEECAEKSSPVPATNSEAMFGLPRPRAATPPENPHLKPEIGASTTDEAAEESAPVPSASVAVKSPNSIEEALLLLKAEQCSRLKDKAQNLHGKVKGLQGKISNVDMLLSRISQFAQQNPDGSKNDAGTVDCTLPPIATVVSALRSDGVNVPLPNGKLEKGERGHAVNVLSNQRSLLSDEQREYAQEFQQCVVEQNSLFQALMSIASELNRVKIKIMSHFSATAAH